MKNYLIVCVICCSLKSFAQTGLYTMEDKSRLIITPSYAPDFRYRKMDGASGRLFLQPDSSYISAPGWAEKQSPNIFVRFTKDVISFRENGKELHGKKILLKNIPVTFGDSLYGELFLPPAQVKAVVVLQFGSGKESAVANNYVQYLLPGDDIAVFVFDKRGTGKSKGEYTADFVRMAKDMAAAVEKIRTMRELQKIPLGIMGESQGGWVVPLTASLTQVDFVIASYSLAISPQEENRQEVIHALTDTAYKPQALAVAAVTDRVVESKFKEGMAELKELKNKYGDAEWYKKLGGDYTGLLANATDAQIAEFKQLFSMDIDLEYDPMPALRKVKDPMLWVIAGKDTEAPNEETIARVKALQAQGAPFDLVIFPNADHGMIEEDRGHSKGYFELLKDWILTRKISKQYGNALEFSRK
ncbi:alpha/beta hydrolase [Chitinophaga sp.]|uniref:alpha/beta hydrolase family protein n=1 Tax=Chitinophaga sp. TaxID=1869181 RepID=UPI0031DA4A30